MRAYTFCRRSEQFRPGIQDTLVGDFEVATSGGFWVAITGLVADGGGDVGFPKTCVSNEDKVESLFDPG